LTDLSKKEKGCPFFETQCTSCLTTGGGIMRIWDRRKQCRRVFSYFVHCAHSSWTDSRLRLQWQASSYVWRVMH